MRVSTSFLATSLALLFLAVWSPARADDTIAPAVPTVAADPIVGSEPIIVTPPALPSARVVAAAPDAAASASADGPWDGKLHIAVTPYVWLPTINASFRYQASQITLPDGTPLATDGSSFDNQIGPNSYLANINFALMAYATARIGNVALYTDILNANVSGAASSTRDFTGPFGDHNLTITTSGQTQAVTTLWTIGPSYTLFHNKGTSLDLLVGGQFAWITTNAGFQVNDMTSGRMYSVGGRNVQNFNDFIVGLYGQVALGGHWSIPYYVDGGFGTPTTWQGIGGIKYGNIELGWRYLQFNAASSTALIQRLSLGGPMLGYTIRF
jgi:hypothetical protein